MRGIARRVDAYSTCKRRDKHHGGINRDIRLVDPSAFQLSPEDLVTFVSLHQLLLHFWPESPTAEHPFSTLHLIARSNPQTPILSDRGSGFIHSIVGSYGVGDVRVRCLSLSWTFTYHSQH